MALRRVPSATAQHGEHGKMKLYSVITTVKEYSGCKNVIFRWFREGMPQGQRPYADLIKDYEPGNPAFYATQVFVEELFTWDEAQQLKTYLDDRGPRGHGNQRGNPTR